MKKVKSLLLILIAGTSFLITSCDKDNDDYDPDDIVQTPTSSVSKPTFDKNLTTTTYSDVSMRCRFTNGGDTWEHMSCTVHWKKYATKPSSSPKASDLTNSETMRQYSTTSTKTTFDKTHTGLSGGTYVYYYFECKNSKYTTKTDVTYCVIKR